MSVKELDCLAVAREDEMGADILERFGGLAHVAPIREPRLRTEIYGLERQKGWRGHGV
jgi:hypothetical protein